MAYYPVMQKFTVIQML